MSGYKTDQHRLTHRGKVFHFVSYEGHAANVAKDVAAEPPMWYLMSAGHRIAVMPEQPDETVDERNDRFRAWLDEHVFKGVEVITAPALATRRGRAAPPA